MDVVVTLEAKLATQPGAAFGGAQYSQCADPGGNQHIGTVGTEHTGALRSTVNVANLRAGCPTCRDRAGRALWHIGERLPYRVNVTWAAAAGLDGRELCAPRAS